MPFATTLVTRIEAFGNTLGGTTLKHPLHPMLADSPIGAWSAAGLLDTAGTRVIGGRGQVRARS